MTTISKLNSTGTLWYNEDSNTYYSYNTPLTYYYKDRYFYNNTFYSMTTRKHQSILRHKLILGNNDKYSLLSLKYCPYGPHSIESAIRNEMSMLNDEYIYRLTKRKTNKNKSILAKIVIKYDFLNRILYE